MASTEETFREAVRQMFGDKWEVTTGALGGMSIYCRTVREIPESWFRASRSNPGAFIDRVRSLMVEMMAEIDPQGADRWRMAEQGRAELQARLTKAEAALTESRATIAELFRQARQGSET